jgi:hypothetical protein
MLLDGDESFLDALYLVYPTDPCNLVEVYFKYYSF